MKTINNKIVTIKPAVTVFFKEDKIELILDTLVKYKSIIISIIQFWKLVIVIF